MPKRSLLHHQREWLQGELDVWRESGLISAEQSAGILGLYESPHDLVDRRRSYAILVLMSAAALLCGFAVLLLVAYNWQELGSTGKLGVTIGALLATHAGAFHLRYRRQARLLSEAAIFLACLLYGASIVVVAQVFHLDNHPPNGIWLWAIGILPFALCLDTLLLHGLLVAVLALWSGMEIFGYGYMGRWLLDRWPEVPNGAYTLPLLALPGLAWAYRRNSPATVALYAGLLAWWATLQPFAWHWQDDAFSVFGIIGSVAVLLLVVADAHRNGSPFATPYRVFGLLLIAGWLIPLSFYELYDELDAPANDAFVAGRMLVTLAIPLAAFALAIWCDRWRRQRCGDDRPLSMRWRELADRLWFPTLLLAIVTYVSLSGIMMRAATDPLYEFTPIGHADIVGAILANVGMLACAFWMMQMGLREDRGQFFASGVLYFLLWAVLRYADLFGDFGGMLGASFMFFLCAGALFGVALYWHKRKEIRND